jgi:hypothetical protein
VRSNVTVASHILLAQQGIRSLRHAQHTRLNGGSRLRQAEHALPGRTHHTIKDRCYRISEVLRDAGLPWVDGWNPPSLVGQRPNSPGTTRVIERAILHEARAEFGEAS